MRPYTYLIGWKHHNMYYYGVRYAVNCNSEELWKTYFTSSKHVVDFRVKNGEPDIIEIRKTFDNATDAKFWETKVLRRIKANINPRFINKTTNASITNNKEHYEKLGNKFRGKKRDKSVGQKISAKFTDERKKQSKENFRTYGSVGVYEVTFPDGSIQKIINLKRFCATIGFNYSYITSLSKLNKPFKGHTFKKIATVATIRTH
jgi:hypothetical protein